MSCHFPLKRFSWLDDDGQECYKVTSHSIDHLEEINKSIIPCDSDYVSLRVSRVIDSYVDIPCGKCTACRLEYSRQWANRCMLELQYHCNSYFVTLTYDDDHLPVNCDSGWFTLVKSDLQDFMKRLRRNYEYAYPDKPKLRFYAAGEYGSESARPHYHLIIFGLDPDDLVFYKKNFQGDLLWNSEIVSKSWQYKGYAVLAKVTWETCAYVARYIMKKQLGKESCIYDEFGIQPEFTLMSRDPGIARQYFEDHPECMNFDFIHIKTDKGGKKFKPPRYFEKLYDDIDPVGSAHRKMIKAEQAQIIQDYKVSHSDKNYMELLKDEEDFLNAKLKSLRRNII